MSDKAAKKEQRRKILNAVSNISQIGFTIVACVLVGVLLGSFLDKLFGTAPWLLLIFSLFGAGAAFKSLYQYAREGDDDYGDEEE
ncbi:MAG: AtpZ/AtpI family protein [Oscillospiraceae bacterium]|nr:AtpZ/AtpI family protein [Oscillospiraceae bacterium]